MTPEPAPDNSYASDLAQRIIASHHRLTGRDLIDPELAPAAAARALYDAPFAVLAHDTAADPCFIYANLAAQARFEMNWREMLGLPSRLSAEPLAQVERARLLASVARDGFIVDYSGVRIAKSGRRFIIRQATVWNLLDADGVRLGQAATFSNCVDLSD